MQSLKQIIISLTVLVVAIILLTLVFHFTQKSPSKYAISVSNTTVIKELRDLNRLETASFTIEKVIDAGTTSDNKLQQFLFGDKLLLIAHGQVIAGIDMSKLHSSAVQITGSTIHMALPAPEILVTTLDNDQTRVYDRSTGVFSKGDKDLETEARKAAETSIKDAACQGDILAQAADNARKQLTALLKTLRFVTVIINIPQGRC